MNRKYDNDYQKKLRLAWEKFINYEDFDYSFIRPEILDSWKRSRASGVNPYGSSRNILSTESLNIKINSNLDLIDVVHPYMEKLFSIVKDSGFYILFCDKDGFILDLIGDKEIIEHGKNHTLLVVGANRQESVVGTNAIGTCLALKQPLQIWSEEHYIEKHKDYVCSGAPFFDPDGNILGCLAITGRAEDVHPHTLGMVISAVDGITKELNIKQAYEDIELISAQRNSIIEAMPSGLILLNNRGRVIQINSVALGMFSLRYEEIIGKNLFDFIILDDHIDKEEQMSLLQKEIYNKEVNISRSGSLAQPVRFNMSINFVKETNGKISGTVIRFNEPKVINSLVNTVSGFNSKYDFSAIIGNSDITRQLIENCKRAAQSSSNVLILGESGTGKELLAQAMHNMSPFSSGPFVAINCAALPKGLVESELFGYEKGAFTGANKSGNPGKFELADGGTIFLDEIGDMPLDVQASVLRVIQTKEIIRVGGKFPKTINVRIIAATNRDLQKAIEEKTFREDLYYRLNVLPIQVPPLAKRGRDICELADYFCTRYSQGRKIKIRADVYPLLLKYDWPGNIRELENVIERAVNITDTSIITPSDLPPEVTGIKKQQFSLPSSLQQTEEQQTSSSHALKSEHQGKALILDSLEKSSGNVTEAAKLLGISRRTFYRKLDKFHISSDDYRNR